MSALRDHGAVPVQSVDPNSIKEVRVLYVY